jgi:predicted nucleic acid-binding protein
VWNLGDGETEVLSWALNNKNQYRALIDDRAARNCAKTLGLSMLGTGGILVLAKRRGLIDSVGKTLIKLQDVGLYISEEIVFLLKKQAGE